jgi:hypothetical protein
LASATINVAGTLRRAVTKRKPNAFSNGRHTEYCMVPSRNWPSTIGDASLNNSYAEGFKWAVILGIAFDWFFALPGIFIPQSVIAYLDGAPARLAVWPAFAALLVFIVTLFFFSGACDINRYRANAWLAVLGRLAAVFFFFCLYPGVYPLLAWVNLFLLVVLAYLLATAIRIGAPVRP